MLPGVRSRTEFLAIGQPFHRVKPLGMYLSEINRKIHRMKS